ncbi:MAG: hypothetical protein Q4E57_08135 [Eubacteriales bacterium]|nr:hypothetical protein [Eubacteriales bacterium]
MSDLNYIESLHSFIENYAEERGLKNTLLALPAARELLEGKIRKCSEFDREGVLNQSYYEHCLQATKMLIDIMIPLSHEDEDILIAGALLHDTIAHAGFKRGGRELVEDYHLDEHVYKIVRVTTTIDGKTDEDLKEYYDEIAKDRLAVLLAMADRGNLVENLYALSINESLEYISEIRKYALPMCVSALERYPDVLIPMRVLMSKVHSLIDVTDIISHRYKDRKNTYEKEILSLMEENSRLRGLIAQGTN